MSLFFLSNAWFDDISVLTTNACIGLSEDAAIVSLICEPTLPAPAPPVSICGACIVGIGGGAPPPPPPPPTTSG